MAAVKNRRFMLPGAGQTRGERFGPLLAIAALLLVPLFMLNKGGYVLVPFASVLPIAWLAHWGLMELRRFELDRDGLSIVYRLWRRRVPFKKITAWRRVPAPDLADMHRLSFSRRHFARELGERFEDADIYVTGIGDLILVELSGGRRLLLGPAKIDRFEQVLGELLPAASQQEQAAPR